MPQQPLLEKEDMENETTITKLILLTTPNP